jgi:tRNA pseudouridine55 synthase
MHSAKKVGGKALYELARQGLEVARKSKNCQVRSFQLSNFKGPHPSPQSGEPVTTCEFVTAVTAGTYIRVLAQDLGKKLGTRALLETLRREGSGPKQLQNAVPLNTLLNLILSPDQALALTCGPYWVPFDRVLDGLFPELALTADEVRDLDHGKKAGIPHWVGRAVSDLPHSLPLRAIALRDPQGHLRGVLECTEAGLWDIARVFPRIGP